MRLASQAEIIVAHCLLGAPPCAAEFGAVWMLVRRGADSRHQRVPIIGATPPYEIPDQTLEEMFESATPI